MDSEFELIFMAVGWEDAWEIDESGCKLLTIEFLCTLQTTDSEVSFRFFGKASAAIKVSISGTDRSTRRINPNGEVRFGGLKIPSPRREVTR